MKITFTSLLFAIGAACGLTSVSTAHAQAGDSRPSPNEVRSWTANGASYGFMCTVVGLRGATVRRQMNGAVVGRLPRGKRFVLSGASYDQAQRIWYRADFVYQSPLRGWMAASDLFCEATSFH